MEIFDIIKSVIFGIVEGITEWLPISSTGHMILLNEILPLRIGKNPDDFYSMFEVVIQLGAILAVVVLFWSQIWPFGRKNNKAPLAKTGIGAWVKTDIFVLWFHILVSTVPAAIIKILFGEGSTVLLDSKEVYPKSLLEKGFVFKYPDLESSLKKILA
jgi:undecaprenyl-diphosphatase